MSIWNIHHNNAAIITEGYKVCKMTCASRVMSKEKNATFKETSLHGIVILLAWVTGLNEDEASIRLGIIWSRVTGWCSGICLLPIKIVTFHLTEPTYGFTFKVTFKGYGNWN